VERIGPRSTEVITLDRISIIVPNARFLESEVLNWSHTNPITRLQVPVGVAYGSNPEKVRQALLEVARGHREILRDPAPQVWFQEFGDSSLNFTLLVWIDRPREQFRLKSELNYRIEESLRRHQLEVPFPQRDIHWRSPELDKAIATWLKINSPPEVQLYYPPGVTMDSKFQDAEEDTCPIETHSPAEEIDIPKLVERMRGPEGVKIKDRRYGLKSYSDCFVGLEAVDWLVRDHDCSRQEAVEIGQLLVERGIIHHVVDRHSFKDEYLFYRFYVDEVLSN